MTVTVTVTAKRKKAQAAFDMKIHQLTNFFCGGKHDSKQQKQFGNLFGDMKQGIDDLSEGTYESVNEAKIAFINDKLIGDRIQKSGLLPLLGDNNVSLNPNKVKFTRELRDTLVKLYKKYSSLTVK